MDKINHNGVCLSARTAGCKLPARDGAARPVLLLHGLAANMAFWHPALVQQLGAARPLIMFDMRGHGYSDMPSAGYTPDDLAMDALAALDHYDVKQADVVAHSFGASAALRLVQQSADRAGSLTILDARVRGLQPVQRLSDWPAADRWLQHFRAEGVELSADQELDFLLPLLLSSERWQEIRSSLEADGFAAPAGGRRSLAQYRKLLTTTTARRDFMQTAGLTKESLRQVSVPTLVVYGANSPYLPTRDALVGLLSDCRSVEVALAGHSFPRLRPADTVAAIEQFYSEPVLAKVS